MYPALTSARRALADHGLIFSIHPAPDRAVIYCDGPGRRRVAGLVRGSRTRYRNADEREIRAVRRGLFALRYRARIPYMHYTPSLQALRAYLAAEWCGAWIDRAIERRIRALFGRRGVGPIAIKEWVRVSLLEKR
jgi:hypothetical protein